MTSLRKGTTGQTVRALQESLNKSGFRIGADGQFGPRTELAVRTFQRQKSMLPDGIAGPKTLHALAMGSAKSGAGTGAGPNHVVHIIGGAIAHAAGLARMQPASTQPSRAPIGLKMSPNGLQFIYTHEAMKGVSNHLHWPGGASGVTLGPGYDMKERSAQAIERDMEAIGLDAPVAKQIGGAAGLAGSAARQFAVENKAAVNLTSAQETALLTHIVPRYEAIVRSAVTVDLLPHEFDALVSFAYNPGGRFRTVAHNINLGNVADAMKAIKLAVTSSGIVMKGLVNRRDHEVALYLYGNYGHLRR